VKLDEIIIEQKDCIVIDIQIKPYKRTDMLKKDINKIISKHISKAMNPNTQQSQDDGQKNLFHSPTYKKNSMYR